MKTIIARGKRANNEEFIERVARIYWQNISLVGIRYFWNCSHILTSWRFIFPIVLYMKVVHHEFLLINISCCLKNDEAFGGSHTYSPIKYLIIRILCFISVTILKKYEKCKVKVNSLSSLSVSDKSRNSGKKKKTKFSNK